MPTKPQELKWYQISIRDKFMLAGMFSGILLVQWSERHLYPVPDYFWTVGLALTLAGAGIGEFVKRRQARSA